MSYKKKKFKKDIINQLKRRVGLIIIVLFKKINKLIKKEAQMQQYQTRNIMKWLRDRARTIRPNNLKINEWVEEYIDQCILNGKPVEILTQFCLSKDLEVRYQVQGNRFVPIKAENKLFIEEIPLILGYFKSSGISVNWCITLNRSYLDSGRIVDIDIENQYQSMIQSLIEKSGISDILLMNWEDDLLKGRPKPNSLVQNNVFEFISDTAFQIDLERHTAWVRNDAKLVQTDAQIEEDLRFQIACEAEEGRLLMSNTSPFSNAQFILVPFELPERYVFFKTLAPDFQKRIVPILKPYPWRMDVE